MDYTELAAKKAKFVIFDFYDCCRFWALSRKVIQQIQRFKLKKVLGIVGNELKCLTLIDEIEWSDFHDLPGEWSTRVELQSLVLWKTGCGADFRYYNPFTSRFIREGDMSVVLREMDRCISIGSPCGLGLQRRS